MHRQPRYRAARRREIQGRGITPTVRRWVWHIRAEAFAEIPGWVVRNTVRGLGQVPGQYWLWDEDAKRLMGLLRRGGGHPTVTRVELRHCGRCERPLVGSDAERRRKLDESLPNGRMEPCGAECDRDTLSRVWRKLYQR